MADQTAVRDDKGRDGVLVAYKMAAVKIWKGALVNINSDGYADKAGDDASEVFAGVAEETIDNSGGSAGDKKIRVRKGNNVELAFGGTATQATVGDQVYAVDDQTVDLAGVTSNDVLVGEVTEFVDASTVRVQTTPGVRS